MKKIFANHISQSKFLFRAYYVLFPEKGMEIHSSIFAWRSPWTEGPGGLQSMWLQRVGHD